jgi:hypothetical protein
MAQDLTVNIKTTSDVPQAMDKAKAATVSFSKQVDDIGRKFSMAFKDIAFAFVAPLVLLNSAINFISEAIAKAKQDAQDGLNLLAKGETVYASSEEKKMANFFKAKQERESEQKSVKDGLAEITRLFLDSEEGRKVYMQFLKEMGPIKFNEEEAKKQDFTISNPRLQKLALDAFLASPEGKMYQPLFNDTKKDQNFKGPEGFSNVVGVGANPVMEAMNEQLEIQKQQLAALQEIANKGTSPTDFTKESK